MHRAGEVSEHRACCRFPGVRGQNTISMGKNQLCSSFSCNYSKFSFSRVSGGRGKTTISVEEFGYIVVFPSSWNRLISENVCRLNINVPMYPVENMPTYTDHTQY